MGTVKNMKILVVEDDQILLRMLATTLVEHGFDVFEAKNGRDGLTQAATEQPDLIVLDIDMPKMDGLAALKEFRIENKHTPVIMLTNLNHPNMVADAAELGISEYLIKADWDIDDIVRKIEEKLQHQK